MDYRHQHVMRRADARTASCQDSPLRSALMLTGPGSTGNQRGSLVSHLALQEKTNSLSISP